MALIAGREVYALRTIRTMEKLGFAGSVLGLRGRGLKAPEKMPACVQLTSEEYDLTGMCSIFQAIDQEADVIRQFDFAAYCDDDNLINPEFMEQAVTFLNREPAYAGCNGKRFLCQEVDDSFAYLAPYATQVLTAEKPDLRLQQYCQQGGILFYATFRSDALLAGVAGMDDVQDDNAAEILLNYRLPKFGKIALLNVMQLVRPYPRPAVFNIPSARNWLQAKGMHASLLRCIRMLMNDYGVSDVSQHQNDFFQSTVGMYLQRRFGGSQPRNPIVTLWKRLTDFSFRLIHNREIRQLLTALNAENKHRQSQC